MQRESPAPDMRRLALSFLFSALVVTAAAAEPERQIKPYPPVAITLAAPPDDDSFTRFRNELAAVAKARIYAALARLVRAQDFFSDRDPAFDPRKPAVDNLALALALERNDGSGWTRLAAFATEAAVEPLESRPGVVCAPARPSYDGVAFARLLDVTYTAAHAWAYPLTPETKVQAAPQSDAALLATLGPYFIHRLGFESTDEAGRTRWARVATPEGKTGFVAPGVLRSLAAARLCYIKDPVGGWRIAGYVAQEN
jgi:hypothetical protein